MALQDKNLESIIQLQKLMPKLLQEHGSNLRLMKAALANPILALEELGYKIGPILKLELEDRVRFSKKDQNKITEITKKINVISGKNIRLNSKVSVEELLKNSFKEEKISIGEKTYNSSEIVKTINTPLASRFFQKDKKEDPLQKFEGTHKIVPLLLAYRTIEATVPKLASKKTFDAILNGKEISAGIAISKVSFRIQDRNIRKTRA